MKKIKILLTFFMVFLSCNIFSGCTSEKVSLMVTCLPNKIVYDIGEEVNFDGLKVESYNTDGTNTLICVKNDDISKIDTSSAGEKVVVIKKDNLTTTFKIYVANSIIDNNENFKRIISTANNNDIIHIKKGEYKPKNYEDESLYNILINKKLTLIGDGKDNTILHGNLLIGAKESSGNFIPLDNFSGVNIFNMGFKLESKIVNRFLKYEGPYENYDIFGAIKTFNSNNINISNCSFDGYCYGVNSNKISNLTLKNNYFQNIKIYGFVASENITNSVITKNCFIDIGSSSLVYTDKNKQGSVGAVYLSFLKAENVGVIVSNNNFTRIGLVKGDLLYVNPGANELELNNKTNFNNGVYVNNSAILFLVSNTDKNLNVSGIILSSNNFGKTLKNISFGTNDDNLINQSGVIINNN